MNVKEGLKRYYLNQGMILVRREESIITTVLGSCISVCIWSPAHGIGGMNHYMLPLWNGEGLPSPRYGNIAIQKLIQNIIKAGCVKKHLKAKVFGGAEILSFSQKKHISVGLQNILLAEEILAAEHIPIVSTDVGGQTGRRVHFNTKTGVVLLKRLNR
jgi:chemotaxis protein CheD